MQRTGVEPNSRVEQAHRLFREGGEVPPQLLSERVLRSWQRSRTLGLSSDDRVIYNAISRSQQKAVEERNRILLSHAEPELRVLFNALGAAQWLVACIDTEGVVVRSLCTPSLATGVLIPAFRTGVNLSESVAGTTGPACALIEQKPSLIRGAEHYLKEAQNFTCAAVPIFAPDGQMAGVLDASRQSSTTQLAVLEPLCLSARAIENRMLLTLSGSLRISVHVTPDLSDSPMRGLLAFSEEGRLLGATWIARQLLGIAPISQDRFDDLFTRPFGAAVDALRRAPDHIVQLSDRHGLRLFARLETDPTRAPTVGARPSSASAGVYADAALQRSVERARRAFARDLPVLITGETGTGKEVLARQLHEAGPRRQGPFVAVNCSAIPAGLIESELFGYEPGAFTGARRNGMPGKFEQAQGGTLFLDEIGDMPAELQARLLRVLQERRVTRLGGQRELSLDLSLICATHRQLQQAIAQGEFREDLYYRIRGFQVDLLPLRERADLCELIDHLLQQHSTDASPPQLTAAARQSLLRHHWPGNIRELAQILRCAVALCESGSIDIEHLPPEFDRAGSSSDDSLNPLERAEYEVIRTALQRHQGNHSATARTLGLARATLYRKMRRYGMPG